LVANGLPPMGYRLTPEVIARIRENSDIVEIISGYLTLKRAGRNFKALCPFHNEKTASFIVTPEKNIFHCFGCGAGGDAISFIMRMENISFPEAAALLAKRAGITIEFTKEEGVGNELKTRILQLNYKVALFFHQCLLEEPEAETARQYLKKRNVSLETIKNFMLGFAPSSFRTERFLQKEGFAAAEIETAGIKFFQRITFPIFNLSGECVGFGARSLNGSEPKYLNTAETPVFSKGNFLYGLNLTRKKIQEKGEAILVEGYLDLIKPFQYGFCNIVAGLGTALTPIQARLLRRFTDRIVLLYDGDAAGKAAAVRNLEVLLAQEIIPEVVLLPEGFDPDSFLEKKGGEALAATLQRRQNPVLFRAEMALEGRNPDVLEDRLKAAQETIPLLFSVESPLRRKEYLTMLAEKLRLDEGALRMEFQRMAKKMPKIRPVSPRDEVKVIDYLKKGLAWAEEMVLALALDNPHLRERLRVLEEHDFSQADYREIFQVLTTASSNSEEQLNERLGKNPQMMEVLSRMITWLKTNDGDPEEVFNGCLNKILEHRRTEKKKRDIYEEKIKDSTEPDPEALRHFQELVLQKHRKEGFQKKEGEDE